MINEDIIAQLGYTLLDEFIGDPEDLQEKSYPELIRVASNYWKKYSNANDMNAFIQMFFII